MFCFDSTSKVWVVKINGKMFDLIKILRHTFKANRTIEKEELTPLLTDHSSVGDGYIPIGKVVHFVIYPIDCGLGFKFKKAICTANGIQMIGMEKKYLVDDRTLIVYNKSTMEALVDPKFTITAKKDEILLYCLGELFKQRYENLEVIQVNYLGTVVPLRIFPIDSPFEIEIQNKIFKAHEKNLLGLGFCTKENRRLLNEKHRFRPSESNNLTDNEMKMAFLPNFSNYTLINTCSYTYIVDDSRKKPRSLNYRNFRPQIVVDLQCSFAEDNIEEIKIGPYIFNRIIPCVTEATNYNPKCLQKKFSQVYQRLLSERTLFKIYPRFANGKNPILPIFGLNMELKQDPKAAAPLDTVIQKGYEVKVKYFKSASLNSPTVASTSKPANRSMSAIFNPPSTSRSPSIPVSRSVPVSRPPSIPVSRSVSVSRPPSIPVSRSVPVSRPRSIPVSRSVSISAPKYISTYTTVSTTVAISASPTAVADEVTSDLAFASISTPTVNYPTNTIPDSENSSPSNSADAFAVEPESNLPSVSTSTHTIDCPINTITDSESNSADASTIESAPDSAYASISVSTTSAASSDIEPSTSAGKK